MNENKVVIMPDLTKKRLNEVESILDDKNLQYNVIEEYSSYVDSGLIFKQLPASNSKIRENRTISLIISKGSELITVPDLIGLTFNDVLKTINKIGRFSGGPVLKIGNISKTFTKDDEKGKVISQSPSPGRRIEKDIKIDLLISEGEKPKEIFMPDVTGKKIEIAEKMLIEMNLQVEKIEQIDKEKEDRIVLKQSPEPLEKIDESSVVTLYFNSLGHSRFSKKNLAVMIPYTTPKYLFPKRVKIILYDATGTRVIYDKITAPAKKILVPATVSGEGNYKVYIDGKLKEIYDISPD